MSNEQPATEPVVIEAEATLPEVSVTPDRYTPVRYAGASGDFNPIHVDDDFAAQVGLPGRILHGLWTMAQVARAQTQAADTAGLNGAEALAELSVEFRGMAVPDQEIVVQSTVSEVAEGVASVNVVARQGKTRVVRNGKAKIRLS